MKQIIRRHALTVVGFVLSLSALAWLAHRFDLEEIIASFRTINTMTLLPVPLLIIMAFLLRAYRWTILIIDTPVRLGAAFRALMIGYLMNNVLPARAGDLVRALSLARTIKVSKTSLLGTIVAEHTGDLVVLFIFISLVLIFYPALPEWLKHTGGVVVVLAASSTAFVVAVSAWGDKLIAYFRFLLLRILSEQRVIRVEQLAASFFSGLAGFMDLRRAAGFMIITGCLWFIEVMIIFFVAKSFDLNIAPGNLFFVLLFIALGTMVPSAPGFVGTYEYFGVTALGLIGVSGPVALSFIVMLHAISLLGSSIIGCFCLITGRATADDAGAIPSQNNKSL